MNTGLEVPSDDFGGCSGGGGVRERGETTHSVTYFKDKPIIVYVNLSRKENLDIS